MKSLELPLRSTSSYSNLPSWPFSFPSPSCPQRVSRHLRSRSRQFPACRKVRHQPLFRFPFIPLTPSFPLLREDPLTIFPSLGSCRLFWSNKGIGLEIRFDLFLSVFLSEFVFLASPFFRSVALLGHSKILFPIAPGPFITALAFFFSFLLHSSIVLFQNYCVPKQPNNPLVRTPFLVSCPALRLFLAFSSLAFVLGIGPRKISLVDVKPHNVGTVFSTPTVVLFFYCRSYW